jgi:ATP-binding cassette subfamily B protein
MFRLKKYVKPFFILLIIAVGLLYLQAQMDLALPDYLSRIVNIGIQQNGVEDEIPKVLEKEDYEKLKLFLTESDSDALSIYTLSSSHDYTDITSDDLYITDVENNELINQAFLMFQTIEMQVQSGQPVELGDQVIPEGMDVYQIFAMMPDEQLSEMYQSMNDSMVDVNPEMLSQMSINMVKTYYEDFGIELEDYQTSYILRTGALMILITIIGAAAAIAVGYLASKIAAGVAKNLRRDVFNKVMSFSNSEFDQFSTASLITRSTNDITQVQTILVLIIRLVFYAPLMGVGGVIRALDKNVSMSWIIALAVIVLLIVIGTVFTIVLPRFKKIQKLVDKVNLVIREHLSGMLVIRAFNTQKFEEDRFGDTNNELTKLNLFTNRVMAVLFPAMTFVMNGVMVLIIWIGAKEIANANMLVGDMMAYMQYAMQIIMAFLMMSMMFIMVPRASVSAARIADVLDTDISIHDPEEPIELHKELTGVVEFKDVSFKYPGADTDMLKNISFTAKPGETTAIIGSTGSGKTTLVNLINRFYDVTAGSILVSGVDVRKQDQVGLRDQLGYVPQKSFLFSGSIGSNLKYGKLDANEAELKSALEISQGIDLIDEDGFDRLVAQGGQNFSGGQKQRMAIARAVIKKPDVYIFDDSFSALDFKTDAKLRKALHESIVDKTMIVVAQRVSTIMNADQIIVLEDGRMVGKGKHSELLETCKTYYEIASTQLTKEEL